MPVPDAICFDMYGTLFDTQSVTATLRRRVDAPSGLVDDLASLWRQKQLQYSYQVALMDAYEPFWELTIDALEYALDYYGVDLRARDKDAIMDAYEVLDPFDDAVEALVQLEDVEANPELAILSNGNPDMLETLAANTGIDSHLDAIISADEVGTFKPHPSVYENAASRLDVTIDACWLVSSNAWDAAGAAEAGMQVAWVNRANEPYERIGSEPNLVVDTLADLVDELG